MKRNESFDEMAQLYDQVRPSYPEKLIEDIIVKAGIKPEDKLLEIGAGTGKATVQLAKAGFRIHCIELGQNLADILKDKCVNYPNVTVDVGSFEEWEPEEEKSCDLIYCAQAFHWIDPKIKFNKCYDLLKDGGHIALFWYQGSGGVTKLGEEIDAVIRKYVPDYPEDEVEKDSYTETMEMRKSEILQSGLFKDLEVFEYPWESTLSMEMYLKALNSYSKFAIIESDIKSKLNKEIAEAINRHDGIVNSKLVYSLYIARKV